MTRQDGAGREARSFDRKEPGHCGAHRNFDGNHHLLVNRLDDPAETPQRDVAAPADRFFARSIASRICLSTVSTSLSPMPPARARAGIRSVTAVFFSRNTISTSKTIRLSTPLQIFRDCTGHGAASSAGKGRRRGHRLPAREVAADECRRAVILHHHGRYKRHAGRDRRLGVRRVQRHQQRERHVSRCNLREQRACCSSRSRRPRPICDAPACQAERPASSKGIARAARPARGPYRPIVRSAFARADASSVRCESVSMLRAETDPADGSAPS